MPQLGRGSSGEVEVPLVGEHSSKMGSRWAGVGREKWFPCRKGGDRMRKFSGRVVWWKLARTVNASNQQRGPYRAEELQLLLNTKVPCRSRRA